MRAAARRSAWPPDLSPPPVFPICVYRWATDADANALAWTFEAEGDAPTMWERATAAIDGIIARE